MFRAENVLIEKDLPSIGYGVCGKAGYIGAGKKEFDRIKSAVCVALDYMEDKICFIDTAESYGEGIAESIIGEVMKEKKCRDRIIIASKFSAKNNAPNLLEKALDGSLRRLQTDVIDLYQLHWPDSSVPLEDTLGKMVELKRKGKIKEIGVCNLSFGELKRAVDILGPELFSLQIEYSFFDRYIEGIIYPFCRKNNVWTIAYSPINQGNLSVAKESELKDITKKYQATKVQVMLNWLVAKGGITAIPSSITRDHIVSNFKSTDFILEQDDIKKLNDIFSYEVKCIIPKEIRPALDTRGNRDVYTCLQDAIDNKNNNCPSPLELSEFVAKEKENIKPIRVRKDWGGKKTSLYL